MIFSKRISSSTVDWCVVILITYAFAASVYEAMLRPLWYDEIFTAILAKLPTMADTTDALYRATDTSGPVYYWIIRSTVGVLGHNELAYRLPSVLAALIACVSIFLFARRDLGAVAGSVAVLVMLLSHLYHGYSVEARPYALMVMFVCLAALAWQRSENPRWRLVLAASAALAVGTHYYSVFAGLPFVIAEAVRTLRKRDLRISVWLALSAGGVALATVWQLLSTLRSYYGTSYWSKPTLGKAMSTYDWAVSAGPKGAGFGLAAVLGAFMVLLFFRLWPSDEDVSGGRPAPETLVLISGLLSLPFAVAVITSVMSGGYADRYSLGMLAGLGLSVAYAVRALDGHKQEFVAIALAAILAAHETVFWAAGIDAIERHPVSRVESIKPILSAAKQFGLPVVVDHGHDFAAFAYYGAAVDGPELVFLTDPDSARRYIGTDSMDLDMIALRPYVNWNVLPFEEFRGRGTEFLLLTHFNAEAWWPTRLVEDRYRLTVVDRSAWHTIYRVQPPGARP